ncbi:MAG: hypothetical protein IT422_01230 [Pirellulaceae bacterium]|nr:hypothetical protein [Pirellulaceae bacterium]
MSRQPPTQLAEAADPLTDTAKSAMSHNSPSISQSPLPPSQSLPCGANAAPLISPSIVETLDRSLAQWQAQITLAYSQGATQELAEQLQLVTLLNDSLQQREARLDAQRQALEQASANMLQQQSRTQRQRRAIAQTMRAQRAEWMLERELLRQKADELSQATQMPHDEAPCLDETSEANDSTDLQLELQEVRAELSRTQQDLQETSLLLQELELIQKTQPIELNELSDAPQRCSPTDSEARIAELEARLMTAEQELSDLKDQNFDLASQVAKHQVQSSGHSPHINFDASTLSWEERKQLFLRQLEDESDENDCNESATDAAQAATQRLEMKKVIQATQIEIDRRDAEIAELQSIIQQQSDTRQGVAIGAAAFAQAFDNDEIIQQERQKLIDIQLQWEEKLRQAEIDVSLERAKLARERTQLEQELASTHRERSVHESSPMEGRTRKWLEHLGLREENRSTQ